MSELPELLICNVLPGRSDERNSARLLRERAKNLPKLAASVGCSVTPFDAGELKWLGTRGEEPSFASVLDKAQAIWWVGQATYMEEMETMHLRLRQLTGTLPTPPKIFEAPEAVEESFNLYSQYYRLDGGQVYQPETAFCRLPFAPSEYGVDEMASRLRDALREELEERWDALAGEAGRVFFRSYYGTQKLSSYLNAARSFDDLVEGCIVMLESLRHHQPIQGIAVRRWLPIASEIDDLLGDRFRKEYRLFVVDGEVVAWVWQPGRLMGEPALQKRVSAGQLDALKPDASMLSTFQEYGREVGSRLRSRFVAVDIAILEPGEGHSGYGLVEVNPGHCSGWGHDAVAAVVYGSWMQAMLGLPRGGPETHIEAMGCDRWGEDVVYGFPLA